MLAKHVEAYLDFVGHAKGASLKSINTFCWFDGSTRAPSAGRSCVHGTYKHIKLWEQELHNSGVEMPNIHMTLAETDLKGRRQEHIKSYRLLCCDLDREVSDKELLRLYKEYKVQLVVRSSPGRYHLYWQLERGSDLDVWRKFQLGMAHRLGGDLALSLPTSMIRVPGFTRLDKSGRQTMPSILTFEADNKVWPLTIKQVVRLWPWIWDEGELGESKLREQRSKAALVARELMKRRGKSTDELKFARMTPNIGRNITLYQTVREAVIASEDDITLEEAYLFGEEINNAFANPLGVIEARSTISSAFNHGVKAKEYRRRQKVSLVNMLSATQVEALDDLQAKETPKVNEALVDAILRHKKEGELGVCGNYLDISDVLVSKLWGEGSNVNGHRGRVQTTTQNVLASAHRTKYYKRLTDYLIEALKYTGAFKVSGYSVYLKGRNESGESIHYRKNLDSDALGALLQDVLNRLYLHAVKKGLKRGEEGEEEAAMAKKKQKSELMHLDFVGDSDSNSNSQGD